MGGIAARATEPNTVHLVSTAATPLGGDTIAVRVVVEPVRALRVRSAAATVTLPGRSTASRPHTGISRYRVTSTWIPNRRWWPAVPGM